jgi:hypothetical protein
MEYYKRRMQRAEADIDPEPEEEGPQLTLLPLIETPKAAE